jgi:hypothetical protein
MKMSFERKEIMGTMHVFGGVIFRSDFFGTILKLLLIHFMIFIKHLLVANTAIIMALNASFYHS